MSAVERLARAGVALAARRWPADIAGALHQEWQAELHALHAAGRPWRMLTFAVSLAVSPAVDEPAWAERLAGAGRAAVVAAGATVLAAALSNGVHALGDALLPVAAAAMAACGTRARIGAVAAAPLLGLAMFAFLMAGNEVAVMPFMGAADIAPAIVTWTALMLVLIPLCRAVRPRRRVLVAAAGGLLTLGAATVAGAWHAAGVLGVGLGSAPAWFALTLLPGGTARFGPVLPDGAYASEVLLGNAAAMTVPLLLVTVFVLAAGPATVAGRPVPARPVPARVGIPAGVAAALAGWGFCELMRRSGGSIEATLHRMLDGSALFGFGFAAHPAGQALVALLIAVLTLRILETRAPVRG
jgi:hypothetical protein